MNQGQLLFFLMLEVAGYASSLLVDDLLALTRITGVEQTLADTTSRSFPDTLQSPSSDSTSFIEWTASAEKTGVQVFQDAIQLAESVLPVLPLCSGDAGLPSFLGASGLPPRLVDVHVIGVRWMPGVYGVVDVTGVPEILGERIGVQNIQHDFPASLVRHPLSFFFAPQRSDVRVPLSSISFVRGPFGGDAIRAWVASRLSSRMTMHFTLDETNSSGQFPGLPYDGQKISARLTYDLSARGALRYYYFNSENEAGRNQPFYLEEQLADTLRPASDASGIGKEHRIFHGLEFSTPSYFIRPFYWKLQTEFRNNSLRVRHHTEQVGIEAGWRLNRKRWSAHFSAEFRDDQISSTTVNVPRTQTYLARGAFERSFTNRLRAHFATTIHNEADWPTALDADFGVAVDLKKHLQAKASWHRRVINPAPAEYASTLPILQSNTDLQPATLQRAAFSLILGKTPQRNVQIQFAVNRLSQPFVLDTTFSNVASRLRNGDAENVPSLEVSADWQLAKKIFIGGQSSWMLNDATNLFWYQNLRRGYARAFVEFHHDFFSGDLATRWRLVWRHYGEAWAPIYSNSTLPTFVKISGASTFDAQLFIQHGRGTIYFSFENVSNEKIDWRPGVAAPGYFLKWGVRVDFRN